MEVKVRLGLGVCVCGCVGVGCCWLLGVFGVWDWLRGGLVIELGVGEFVGF